MMSSNLVFYLHQGLQAATRLGLLTIVYFLTRCLSRKGCGQIQLMDPMEPTNCVPVSIRMKHVQCFCLLWEALLWPIKNNPVCGRTARQQKSKAPTQNCYIRQDPLPPEISNILWLWAGAPRHQ